MSSKKMNKTNLSATVENLNVSPVEILQSAKFTDVTLRCCESRLKAHKVLLAVRSQYFEDYFKRNGMVTEIELKVNFEDLKCIILYMYQGVIVIPVDRKASFLELAEQFSVNIDEKNIFGVRTRMENFAGNGEGCFLSKFERTFLISVLHSVLFTWIEYNESNFQQVVDAGDSEEWSNAPEIVHVCFDKKEMTPSILEEPIEIVSTKSKSQWKAERNQHGKPNVVHINQNDFLKVKFDFMNSSTVIACTDPYWLFFLPT